MARALWKGAISFGLVYIPVQVQAAARGFTERSSIPPEFYETPYYLAPQKGGEKVYALLREALLREALLRTERIGVASFVMHGRQHLAAIAPRADALELNTLRFAEEVLGVEGLELPAAGVKSVGISAKELSMAEKLVEEMTAAFEPQQYHDTYREDLMRRIEEKVRKGETHAVLSEAEVEEPRGAQVIDLMAALRNSLERRGEAPAGRAPARQAPRPRRKTAAAAHRKRA